MTLKLRIVCHNTDNDAWYWGVSQHGSWCAALFWLFYHILGIPKYHSSRSLVKTVVHLKFLERVVRFIIYWACDSSPAKYLYCLWYRETWDWRELEDLKLFPQTWQLIVNPKWISTCFLICCLVLAVFPQSRHSQTSANWDFLINDSNWLSNSTEKLINIIMVDAI